MSFMSAQYWSRLTSCLPQKDARSVFGPIFGVASVFATVRQSLASVLRGHKLMLRSSLPQAGGLCVRPMSKHFGDFSGIILCSACLMLSLVFVRWSFHAGDTKHATAHAFQQAHGTTPAAVLSPRDAPATRAARERALSGGSAMLDSDDAEDGPAGVRHSTRGRGQPGSRTWVGRVAHGVAKLWKHCVHGDAFGLSSLKASPILPSLFVCTLTMQVLATCITLTFQNFLFATCVCFVCCAFIFTPTLVAHDGVVVVFVVYVPRPQVHRLFRPIGFHRHLLRVGQGRVCDATVSRHSNAVSAGVATDCVEVPAGHHRDGRVWPRVLPITPVREFPAAGV